MGSTSARTAAAIYILLAPYGNVSSDSTPPQHLTDISRNGSRAVEGTHDNRSQRSVAHHRPSCIQQKPNHRAATSGFLHHPLGWICS